MGSIASQDFRDGMASGARLLADRIVAIHDYGITPDRHAIAAMARTIAELYGGDSRADLPREGEAVNPDANHRQCHQGCKDQYDIGDHCYDCREPWPCSQAAS